MKRFSFNDFRVDDANREAYEVCRAIAAREPVRPQPVLLLSERGRGKTHLLYSIVNRIRADSTKVGIAYIRAGDFPEPVRNLAKDPSPIQRAENAILLVDGLDGFGQEDLDDLETVVRTFLDNHHYVLLATGRDPGGLTQLSEGFRERLNQGKLVRIGPSAQGRRVEGVEGKISGETEAMVTGQRNRIEELEARLRPEGDTPASPQQAELEKQIAGLSARLEKVTGDLGRTEEELEQVRAERALFSQSHEEIGALRERLAGLLREQEQAQPEAASPDTDRIAQLEGELEEARAQNAEARQEASEVLRRAEMLLDEVQKGRTRFAQAQEEQDLQLREIHHLETLLAQEDGQSAAQSEGATVEDLPDFEVLQTRFEEEQRQVRANFDQSRERLQAQIDELRTELEAVCAERDEAREQFQTATTEHRNALARNEEQGQAARERADALQAEAQAFQRDHSSHQLERDVLAGRLEEKEQELEDLRNEAARSVADATTRHRELAEELAGVCLDLDLIQQSNQVVSTELQALRARLVQQGRPGAQDLSAAIDAEEDALAPPSDEAQGPPAAQRDGHESLAGPASAENGGILEPLEPLGVPEFDGDAEAPSPTRGALHHVEQLEEGLLAPDSAGESPRTRP